MTQPSRPARDEIRPASEKSVTGNLVSIRTKISQSVSDAKHGGVFLSRSHEFPPRRHHRAMTSLLALAAVLTAGAAAAQATSEPDEGTTPQTSRTQLGEIVVTAKHFVPVGAETATKSNIPLIETPQSISVITRDQIDLLNFIDVQQAVRYSAGVFGENYGPDLRYDFITVRGFTPAQYIDGLVTPVTTTIGTVGVDLYAFQSLDILKGPSSVLYGNAPPGGIFNEVSRRASDHFDGEIEAKYGSYNFAQIAGTVTGPITPWLDGRITALYRYNEDEVNLVHAQRLLVAPTFTIKFDDNTKLTPLMYYQYDKVDGGDGGFLPVYGTLLPNPNGQLSRSTNLDSPADFYERDQYAVGYEFTHRFNEWLNFTSNLKYSHYHEGTPVGIYDSGGLVNTTDPTMPGYYTSILQSNFTYAERVASFATDNRFDVTADTGPLRHKILVGVDYRQVRNDADYGFDFGTATINAYAPTYPALATPNFGYPTRYNHQTLDQTGVYFQDQIKFGQFYLMGGGRYDWADARYLGPFTAVGSPTTTTSQSEGKFTYRVGLTYITESGIAPYISYATSFQPQTGTDSVTMQAFKPSEGEQVEGGVKYDARGLPSDIKLYITVAGFDIRQTNVVSTVPSVSPVFGTASGEVEVSGAELEVVGRIHEQLTINAAYSYNHSKVLQSNVPQEIGQPLPTTPENKASLFVDYTLRKGMLAGFGYGAGVRYTDGSAGSLPGAFNPVVYYGQSSTLWDATLHYDMPGWRFAVNASNLFDKTYVARCSGANGCFYGEGREVIGTVTKKF
jgi:iron complex outermembrane recepter protein